MIITIMLRQLLFIILFSASDFAAAEDNSNAVRLELIHRHSPRHQGDHIQPFTRLERVKELVLIDRNRHRFVSSKRWSSSRRIASEMPNSDDEISRVSAELPMYSGADYMTGQYFVTVKVGTPAQKFTAIADTGSDLTWLSCNYGNGCSTNNNCSRVKKHRSLDHRRIFLAKRSSSFQSIPCSSDMCQTGLMNLFSLAICPTPSTPCAYDFRYSDGSSALGLFAKETVTLALTNGRKARVHDVLIGCSESFQGQSFRVANGLLGLGYSKYSFAKNFAGKFGGIFSYCLVDHLGHRNVSNYLTFGHSSRSNNTTQSMQFTRLILGVISPFYAVNIIGISIQDVFLQIPVDVWDINNTGGTILDSGTSLTILTMPAYQPVMAALTASLLRYKKVESVVAGLDYCFNSTGFNESLVPKLGYHFEGGAKLEPPVKSYVIDVADGMKCLGFVSTPFPGTSVIGNIMQQNHLWEFDIVGNKLGFAPSSCT